MRILLVGDYPRDPRLGSTKVLLKLQEEFCTLGHTCDVLLANDLGEWPRHRALRWALAPLTALAAVKRAFHRRGPYDVVDLASAEGLWVAVLRRAGLFSGAAIVARSNGIEHLNYRRMLDDHAAGLLHKPWTRRLWYPALRLSQVAAAARAADRLIVLNEADRAFAISRRWKLDDAIDLVPHGVSTRFLVDVPPPDHPRGGGILFCGTWDAMKGVHYLAGAFSRLIERGRSVNLTILGGAMPAETIRSAFSEAARGHLTLLDRLPEEDVIAAYRSHDVLVFPSSYEGFGMVLLEAMSQGLPVVATPVGCAITLVRHDETGLTVPTRDPETLAAALARLLDDPALRTRLAGAAFARVRDMSWARTAHLTVTVYESALNGKHAFAHA
jgi:glycosyltransferase involved in cell wall biosynthesis